MTEADIKNKNYYIVSGGYDPIHEGHIDSIIESKQSSDGVIVLLNSDKWLCRKKGLNFLSWNTRKKIMENINGVIDVIKFNDNDNTACDGIEKARKKYPNATLTFAKGGDRTSKNIPEIPCCEKNNVAIKFNVGTKIEGNVKPNSSSWILKRWDERKR